MKKRIIVTVIGLSSLLLVSCGSKKEVKIENKISAIQSNKPMISQEEYRDEVDDFFDKVNKLQDKRTEVMIQASKEILDSEEYKEFLAQAEKLGEVQLINSKSSEKMNQSLDAISDYSKALSEYFMITSETNVETFDTKNEQLEKKVNIAQEKLEKAFDGLKN